MTVFGPRLSAWIDQNGAENAIMNGVTPMMIPAPESSLAGIGDAELGKEQRQEGHDAHHGDACADLDRADEVYDMFPVFHIPSPFFSS